MSSSSSSLRPTTPDDVAGKVLRRAEVAKMARKLHERLALASYKTQHGQEGLTFKDIEARMEKTMKRKRPSSSMDDSSTSSSASSGHQIFSAGIASSPMTAPMFSDDINSSRLTISRKSKMFPSAVLESDRESAKRLRSHSMAPPLFEVSRTSWKSNYNLPESSPVYHHGGRYQTNNGLSHSFMSEVSTIPDSPPFGHLHDEDHDELPVSSFRLDSSNFHSSPPRTPPPTRHRNQKSMAAAGEEGADLLLFLATSPSPANAGHRARIIAPSTPPSNSHALPSSMLSTPGPIGLNTPGQPFNFADFVNVTPSPAQGAFGNRTPALTKTPLAAKEARRRLNFDSLAPPSSSPNLSNVGRGSTGKESGLGMELGGELVSSQ